MGGRRRLGGRADRIQSHSPLGTPRAFPRCAGRRRRRRRRIAARDYAPVQPPRPLRHLEHVLQEVIIRREDRIGESPQWRESRPIAPAVARRRCRHRRISSDAAPALVRAAASQRARASVTSRAAVECDFRAADRTGREEVGPSCFRFVGGHPFFSVGIQPAQGGARWLVGWLVVCGVWLWSISDPYVSPNVAPPYQFLARLAP